MEHNVMLTFADGSVRNFRIYGRPTPRAGEVVTLPVNGRLIEVHIDKISGTQCFGSVDHFGAVKMEAG